MTKALLQKAMDLMILKRKFRPEENETLTGFTPRFLEVCNYTTRE